MGFRIGVDIGGTFTDAVAISDEGRIRTAKALTTPGRLYDGVLNAVRGLEVAWSEVDEFIHGTTAGLNAFLERRGARVAILTTAGFRDVYEIGRANRPKMYDVRYRPPTPLVPRRHVFEVDERMGPKGEVVRPIDEAALAETLDGFSDNFDAVAVCLLHAYANPEHERRVESLVRRHAPGLSVVCSADVAPEWREYERTSTTVISAYIAPIVEEYLSELAARLEDEGLRSSLRVMQSNGGVMTASVALRRPIQTLFSGPVGGTIAGVAVARDLVDVIPSERLICVDMGGTSFDVSLVVDGEAEVESQTVLEGHPVLAPAVAIHTIGAGGGSIGHLEAGGLRVGPRSAGAEPGPACYGLGGAEPAITDANLRLGRIPSVARLGGDMALNRAASDAALAGVGEPLGLDAVGLAAGMVAVADAAMANAIREITVVRGIDPREFSLVAFGGAGPLHAVAIAEELEIGSVVVPADPGVLSAYGMLQSDTRHDVVQSFFVRVDDVTDESITAVLTDLERRARQLLKEDGVPDDSVRLESSADLRYLGQEYSVTIPFDVSGGVTEAINAIPDRFAQAHDARYGHSNPAEAVEFVNLRMTAIGVIPRREREERSGGSLPDPLGVERTWFGGEWFETPVYSRSDLPSGVEVAGPAILLEDACTSLIPPNWMATVAPRGHLVIVRG